MNKFSVKQLLNGALGTDEECVIEGWVRSKRDSKAGLSFIALSDGSCFATIQIVAQNNLENYNSDITRLTKDCAIIAKGKIVASLGSGQNIEVLANSIQVVGWVENPDTYPVSP